MEQQHQNPDTDINEEKEEARIIRDIVKLLEGKPFGIAGHILDQAKILLFDCGTVDLLHPRCIAKFAEIEEFLSDSSR